MSLPAVTLDDHYTAESGRVFLTGLQALVRLPMVQMRRDRAARLNTGTFISGYRGSPLGGYDQQLVKAKPFLDAHGIVFQPGVNEDLAATAIWGTQQLGLSPGARKDGVLGIWYGKGPGVDRSGDVFKHGNAAGSSRHGGVLCLAGDDHTCKSSTVPHQSDHAFMSALMPVIYPSSIHEFVEYGLFGIAMSRFSGCWVGMKFISDTVETTGSVDLAGEGREFVLPEDIDVPPGGLNFRWPDPPLVQDERLQEHKGYAAIAFARANRMDAITHDSERARLGIVASGKAYEDVIQALRELRIGPAEIEAIGLRLYKVRMPWPLEPEGIRHFSEGLEEVLVVEERREIVENQIKQQLFNWRADVRPRIIGKFDHKDRPFLPLSAGLTVGAVARAIADRILHFDVDAGLKVRIEEKLHYLEARGRIGKTHTAPLVRLPYFCSGCPHNTSTRVPEGSRALAGIGCHYMAQWMDRRTETFSQMGGEGVAWTGLAPFTDEKHVFVNLGDGTYFHSGYLAIRQAVAAKANVTYKVLYNDAVAMTGGQHVDGELSPQAVTRQLHAEGVAPIYLLSDAPEAYDSGLAPGVIVRHRDHIDPVMEELRDTKGCSAIVYVQTCAAEKRRRRSRKLMEDPPKRMFIDPTVCEGCGDCSVQSNCVSIEPLETGMGRKRRINQSSCNKDYSCLKGFCPSFVTVTGGKVRKRKAQAADGVDLPLPVLPELGTGTWNLAIAGVGGTGILTVGAVLGMAAHLDGKVPMILDMAGLAQKGGAVMSHVRIGHGDADVTSPRIVTGGADLLLAADDVVAASKDAVTLCAPERTTAVVNTTLTPVADFVRHRDFDFKTGAVEETVRKTVKPDSAFVDFRRIAEAVAGDAIATNIMMTGYAWQKGLIPVSFEAIAEAIRLNGVAVEANLSAFAWGRRLAVDPAGVEALVAEPEPIKTLADMGFDELVQHRKTHLTAYQNARLARRYETLVRRVQEAARAAGQSVGAARAVAQVYAKLLAYKDEYEVARLLTDPGFAKRLEQQFEGDYAIAFNLAPPILPGKDPNGRPRKREFGPWMMRAFRVLAPMRRLRGTPLDPFGYGADRRLERSLIKEYEALVEQVAARLRPDNEEAAIAALSAYDAVRGFGPVKEQAAAEVRARRDGLLAALDARTEKATAAVAA
ncbi:indolepyruvate ferredoxin oxidoreductase family protein [Marinivivus vitaminiproducens]|uniref:indolepyruvate ferredoxin oxidoreductase family protein n=1 Tax=Marinivivus vitaminiproducens TaxID=3035935 RepID=UPI00279DA1EF|nr:indolepyruvate ferredoxin oxidoreductase family protein [Geminicoccaceae bacterium SCSIO 64248]